MKKEKRLIVGNWKMNPSSSIESARIIKGILKNCSTLKKTSVVACPPFPFIFTVKNELKKRAIFLGSQDVFTENEGSYTGEVSVNMLKSLGVSYVIVGHSERRALGDSNDIVNNKLKTILKAGLTPILCIGEKERDESGQYMQYVADQLNDAFRDIQKATIKKIVIAYEPVWAIGKNATREATPAEILEMSIYIKRILNDLLGNTPIPILYGGSVSPKNSEVFLRDGGVSGLLVGRDSLDPKKFVEIIKIAEKI